MKNGRRQRLLVVLALIAALTTSITTSTAAAQDQEPETLEERLPATTAAAVTAASLPAGFVEETVASGLSNPLGMAWLPDGRFLVNEKAGRIKIVDPTTGTVQATVLDINLEVNTYNDRGLLGLAVHPDFPADPRIFFLYAYDPPEAADPSPYWDGQTGTNRQFSYGTRDGRGHRVSRLESIELEPATNFTSTVAATRTLLLGSNSTWANLGDPFSWQADTSTPWTCDVAGTGTPVPDCIPGDGGSHSIGTIEFAPDGSLYVGMGDAASYNNVDARATRALDQNWLVGKILKVDPDTGNGVIGNPFYEDDGSSDRSKVFHLGLRNPYRFTVDPLTGYPVSGDVGWSRFEELNTGPGGSSFGWPCFEGGLSNATMSGGTHEGPGVNRSQPSYTSIPECAPYPSSGQTPPTWTWCRGSAGTGCPGGSHSAMAGAFYEGTTYPLNYRGLWFADVSAGWIKVIDIQNPLVAVEVSTDVVAPVDMAIGPDTNVYYVDIGLDEVRRIRYVGGGNAQPVAVATADVTDGFAPLEVNFDGSQSYDPDAESLSYGWDFGDDTTDSGAVAAHTYTAPGNFDAILTVTDGAGATDTVTIPITIGNNGPTATITSPSGDITVDIGSTLTFTGTGTDPDEGPLTGSSLTWNGTLIHGGDHTHEDVYSGTGESPVTTILTDHDDDTYLVICLTATDSGGLSDTDCINVFPTEVDYTFASSPTGLDLIYNGSQQSTPFTVRVPVGADRQIDAPLTQGALEFQGWSQGGAASQTITIGSADTTLTATYDAPAFTCSVTGSVLSWTDEGVSTYYAHQTVNGSTNYLGAINGTSVALSFTGGTFQVAHWETGSQVQTTCAGIDPPPFTCSVAGGQLTWTDQGASVYYVHQTLGGSSTYLGAHGGTSLSVVEAGSFRVSHWVGPVRADANCDAAPPAAFSCSVDDNVLSWTDDGAATYYVHQVVNGVSFYLGAETGTSLALNHAGGTFRVVHWQTGSQTQTTCDGSLPMFECSFSGTTLSWTDQDVSAYYVHQIVGGSSTYLGSVPGSLTSLTVANPEGSFRIVHWATGKAVAALCDA